MNPNEARRQPLFRNDQKAMPVRSNHTRHFNRRLDIKMLVAVEQKLRFRSGDVTVEAGESCVNIVVAIVNKARGIVRDENVNTGKRSQRSLNFKLLEEEISSRLVFPRTAEAAKVDAAKLERREMKVANWRAERRTGVVIPFDGQNFSAVTSLSRAEDCFIRQVATRNQEFNLAIRNSRNNQVIVGDDKQIHRMRTLASSKERREGISSFPVASERGVYAASASE